MNEERILSVLRSPHVTEKSARSNPGYRQYAFKVASNATKKEVKAAVEKLFNVKVHAVTVCNVKGKAARFGKITGKQSGWKKAYVALPEGQEIDLAAV